MAFSSLLFLCCFLPAFLAVYGLAPARHRNRVALLGSLAFYLWGAPQVTALLLVTSALDHLLALLLARPGGRRGAALAASLAINLGCLVYFKYANFFIEQVNVAAGALGAQPLGWAEVALPIGISFFTFQKLSYVCDVYAGRTRPAERFQDFLLYVLLFPQLIAGPIVRYHDIAAQLVEREHALADVSEGAFRFCLGLGKKVLVADTLAGVADAVFALPAGAAPVAYVWLGIVCYALQIYFDFAGYSDMAIGLSRVMGFRLLENFDLPYSAASVTEFWRRWHISLSLFMRDYLYVPLGGSRGPTLRTYTNLWLVFLASGLWHGASWTFVLWGAYHGLFLTLERWFLLSWTARAPRAARVSLTFVVVLFGWVLFRSPTPGDAARYAGCMLGLGAASELAPTLPTWGDLLSGRAVFMLALAGACSFLPGVGPFPGWHARLRRACGEAWPAVKLALGLLLVAASLCSLANSAFHPFIYFRF